MGSLTTNEIYSNHSKTSLLFVFFFVCFFLFIKSWTAKDLPQVLSGLKIYTQMYYNYAGLYTRLQSS